jgi:glycosyltransferase involved in cell wall biosynthesis
VLLTYEPPDGGVAENVAQLALGLGALGWEPVVAGPPESNVYERIEAAGVAVNRLPFQRGIGGPAGEVRAARALDTMLARGGFHVVHAHSSKAGALARLVAARRRVPSVYSPHCFAFLSDVGLLQRTFATSTERLLARSTAAIVCVCEDEKERALEAGVGPASILRRVDYGVDACPEPMDADPVLSALRKDGPMVGAIAVLRRQKRLDLLLDAAPDILRRRPDAHVVVVGNGPELENLEAQARRLGLDDEPHFLMMPFEAASRSYLACLDVFVLPSEWEALPIGLLEALACGVPQVTTDVGGIAEAVIDGVTGEIVPPRPAKIADAVVGLLDRPESLAAMSAASRRQRDERFTVERMVAGTASVYASVASGER